MTIPLHPPTNPRRRSQQEVGARLVGPIVYTIEARSRDVWMYFDFARGSVVTVQGSKDWGMGPDVPALCHQDQRRPDQSTGQEHC
jgi:hypothetical protein